MLNCQQVKSIFAATQEELEELVNQELRKLGKRVQHIDFVNPLVEGYGVNIVYWSQDLAATMTCKLETLPEEPEAQDGAALFVAVMHDCQREFIHEVLRQQIMEFSHLYNNSRFELLLRTLGRFAPDDTEEQLE